MKRLFSGFPFLLVLLLFFASFTSVKTYAQASPPPPSVSITPAPSGSDSVPVGTAVSDNSDSTSLNQFTLCPPQFNSADPSDQIDDSATSECDPNSTASHITDFTRTVKVSFSGLPGTPNSDNYRICYRTDYCTTDTNIIFQTSDKVMSYLHGHGIKDSALADTANTPGKDLDFSNFQMTVCGRGDGDLYAQGGNPGNPTDSHGDPCNPKNDHYFHAGHSYLITVYYRDSGSDNWIAVAFAGFYVSHGIPKIALHPNGSDEPLTTGAKFTLSISEKNVRYGGDNNNDYQVVLDRPGASGSNNEQQCGTVKDDGKPLLFNFPIINGQTDVNADGKDLISSGYTIPGTYIFKINERINEGGWHTDACQGGHTYEIYTCNLSLDATKSKCTRQLDPNGDDGNDLSKIIGLLSGSSNGAQLPCNSSKKYVSNPLDCPSLDTAIGSIPLDPVGFISKLLAIVLSIAGIVAILILIYSGYRLLLSRGDKTAVEKAREKITSTIVGLIFIIFSLVLLSVIAHDILKIPGFG